MVNTEVHSGPYPCRSLAEVERLIQDFESGLLLPDDFSHQAHLTVALWYFDRLPAPEAAERFRTGIRQLLARHGINEYNETVTTFWLGLVHEFYIQGGAGRSFMDLVEGLTEKYGNSRLIFDYYSKALLSSAEAKERLVEPDLKPE